MRRPIKFTAVLALAFLAITANGACAADWVASKLRGGVFAFSDGAWHQLERGSVVPDDRIIRTASDGRVQFVRANETIDMEPSTQIRIFDQAGSKFTIVQQHFGAVSIEAEKRQVQHFAVQTEFLAAVVKGTRFSVSTGAEMSNVAVDRGEVEVRDVRHMVVRVRPGQHAGCGQEVALNVAGKGDLDTVTTYQGDMLAPGVKPDRSPAAVQKAAAIAAEVSAKAEKSNGLGPIKKDAKLQATAEVLPVPAPNGNSASVGNGNASSSNAGGNGNSSSSNAGGNGKSNAGGIGNAYGKSK